MVLIGDSEGFAGFSGFQDVGRARVLL